MTTAMIRTVKTVVGVGALLATTVSAFAQAEIIYSNVSTPLNSLYTSTFEFGDQINFAGQNRQVTAVSFEIVGTLTPSASKLGLLKIYDNSGVSGAPGNLLYQSPTFGLEVGARTVNITGVNFNVPESVTWSLTFSGLGVGESASTLLYNPPTVGSSGADFWQKNGLGVWESKTLSPLPANFSMQISAIPEPSVTQLGAAGLLVLGGYFLRRRSVHA